MTTEERVMQLFERADPVPDSDAVTPVTSASGFLDSLKGESEKMTLTATEPAAPHQDTPKRTWLMFAAAAAVVVLIAGLLLITTRSDDGPVEQPVPTSPPAVEPTPQQEGRAPETTPPTSADVEATSLAVGDEFVRAVSDHEPEAALELVAASPSVVRMFSAGTRDEFASLFGWFDAVDWEFEPTGCSFAEPDRVRCEVRQRNDWFDVGEVDPVFGWFSLIVEDGLITDLEYDFDTQSNGVAFGGFVDFVKENHPDDVPVMWNVGAAGEILGPRLTDEAFALFADYTGEYVAAPRPVNTEQ